MWTVPEDLSDAVALFRGWMRENLQRAAAHFGLAVAGERQLGWMNRSISALASCGEDQVWLRVVSETSSGSMATSGPATLGANVFAGLAKPHVLDVYEWEESRQQRAEVLTLAAGFTVLPHQRAARADRRLSTQCNKSKGSRVRVVNVWTSGGRR